MKVRCKETQEEGREGGREIKSMVVLRILWAFTLCRASIQY